MSFVVLVESSRLKECVAYLFSFHISKNQKNTLFKGAKVPSPRKNNLFIKAGRIFLEKLVHWNSMMAAKSE